MIVWIFYAFLGVIAFDAIFVAFMLWRARRKLRRPDDEPTLGIGA